MNFKTIYLPNNVGHGNARRVSLGQCSNDLVALMDADDISFCNRFEKQLERFKNNPSLHIVGGQISEFIGDPKNIIGNRIVPENDKEIKKFMKKRCPMNQVSVMMKRDFVDQVGGYVDWYCEEDYYLWLRMAQANGNFCNVPETLVNVRIGNEMSARRGGWKYFSSEKKLQHYMLQNRIISLPRYVYNIATRFIGEVLLTNKMRTKLFKVVRSKKNTSNNIVYDVSTSCIKDYPPFSVAMCVYGGDNAEWFDIAMESIINQTVQPSEIVLVVDGPIPDPIQNVIDKYVDLCNRGGVTFNVYYIKENQGHGIARRLSVEKCQNDFIALMDADDISVPNRFEQQVKYFVNSDIDVVGGNIAEFLSDNKKIVSYRCVPENDVDIKKYLKKRCPFNQPTVMFRKSIYLKAGGYVDWHCEEDYYLWIRMMLSGAKFVNTGTILVEFRIGNETFQRRGGYKYFRSEAKLQKYMFNNRIIGFGTYCSNILKRFVIQVLLPNKVRAWVYKKFARSKKEGKTNG